MKFLKYGLLCLVLSVASLAEAKQIIIAVIDSGINLDKVPEAKICKDGIMDFTGTGDKDELMHGSNVAGIIAHHLKNFDYCMYIMKVYTKTGRRDSLGTYFAYIMALTMAVHLHPDIVNFSSSGREVDTPEKYLIKALVDNDAKFVVAAGNDSLNLDKHCDAYPACYPGVISVGNLGLNGQPHPSSNYGKRVSMWAPGTQIHAAGVTMTGTSQAAPVVTAILAKKLSKGEK